jgi:hypothetical protein
MMLLVSENFFLAIVSEVLILQNKIGPHIIREISLFLPVYYPAPATININILEGN